MRLRKTLFIAMLGAFLFALPSASFAPVTPFPNGVSSFGMVLPGGGDAVTTSGGETIYFVDSGHGERCDAVGCGTTTQPFVTIDFAIGRCTANAGDIIYVAPGHTETVTGAGGIALDVAGVRIIGLGQGDLRPTVTFTTAAAASMTISAADTLVENIVFVNGIANQTHMIDVSADDVTLNRILCREGSATQPLTCITADGGDGTADSLKILNSEFYVATAGSGDAAVQIGTAVAASGDMTGVEIRNCTIYGDFDLAAVSVLAGGNAQVGMVIANNLITNKLNGAQAIEINGTGSTGNITDNRIVTDAVATAVDPGGLALAGNLWNIEGDANTTGIPPFVNTDGVGIFNASTVAQIEAEATDALEADNLDHLAAASTSVAADADLTGIIVDQSILSHLMTAGADTSDYQASTDSLEALGTDTDAIIADFTDYQLDHVAGVNTTVAADADLTTYVVDQSILSHVMTAGADTSDYQASTDSLEAIGTDTDAIIADFTDYQLDHVAGVDTTVAADADLTTYAVDGSLLSHIMTAGADTSDYQASTDSLEAIGTDTDALIADFTDYQLDHVAGVDTTVAADADLTTYAVDQSLLSHIMTAGADTSDYQASTDSLEAIGTDTDTLITYNRHTLITKSSITSSAIPNNTQTSGDITGAAGCGMWLEELIVQCDATGWATPTNIEFTTDNTKGLTGAAAPFVLEAVGTFGAQGVFQAEEDGDTSELPLYLESGKKIFIHGDNNAGTGAGVCDVIMRWDVEDASCVIAGSDLP